MSEAAQRTLTSEFRAPHNGFQQASGSIHNDEVASKLGFKGGTVPGSVHMDQFVPMLVELYGRRWFETGDISLHFSQATVDKEEVQAAVHPGDQRARLLMFNRAGQQVCVGTASPKARDAASELARRMAEQAEADPARLRIYADVRVGDTTADIPMRVNRADYDAGLGRITERLPLYDAEGVLSPAFAVRLAHMSRPFVMAKAKTPYVGLFGALEVRHLAGPLLADKDYVGRTTMRKITESPKTENVWYDVDIADAAGGQDVASVTFMIRAMKASSPLWT
ncbi:hypothetical protein [Phenylobacterium sp.]|uniref:hypothetical protein n=1 Tax=Phenylobacterium sp. TaxID=1871053 RepID=UPI0028A162D9|nr:hypothetical protein [Phenylobacterium sp.]